MGTDGSVSDLKWELIVKVHWGKAIRPLIRKIHDKYVMVVTKIKKGWRELKTRLGRQLSRLKNNSALTSNATLLQSLDKRSQFLDDLKEGVDEPSQIVHLLRKWSHAPMPETEDILQLKIVTLEDSRQALVIPLRHHQLSLDGYRQKESFFYRTIDFRNQTDVVTNLEGLKKEITKAVDNSLFFGIDQKYLN